jgi:hypothetical protein
MLHRRAMQIRFVTAAVLLSATIPACDRAPSVPPASQPSATSAPVSQPSSAESRPATPPALLAESADWTLETCLERLRSAGDDDAERARRSAAVRLVRLAKFSALAVPEPLPDEWGGTLHVAALADDRWCMGVHGDGARSLGMPVLIDADGKVSSPASEAEEEAAQLFVSDDADVFPHVLLTPTRVVLIEKTPRAALVARTLGGARFDYLRREEKWPYIALVVPNRAAAASSTSAPASAEASDGDAARPAFVEVAMYRWDPDEQAFLGPGNDKLPDPPGGKFELDLQASKALIPVGGDIPDAPAPPVVPVPKKPKVVRPPD